MNATTSKNWLWCLLTCRDGHYFAGLTRSETRVLFVCRDCGRHVSRKIRS